MHGIGEYFLPTRFQRERRRGGWGAAAVYSFFRRRHLHHAHGATHVQGNKRRSCPPSENRRQAARVSSVVEKRLQEYFAVDVEKTSFLAREKNSSAAVTIIFGLQYSDKSIELQTMVRRPPTIEK